MGVSPSINCSVLLRLTTTQNGDTVTKDTFIQYSMTAVAELKKQYKSFKEAKVTLGVKARSWEELAKKLDQPTYEQLTIQVQALLKTNQELIEDIATLKNSIAKTKEFDEVGFWLLDNNFDRSRFPDFSLSEEATKKESAAKAFHKQLAKKYHPDNGGTPMQMANLNKLFEQVMALVELNGGLGK